LVLSPLFLLPSPRLIIQHLTSYSDPKKHYGWWVEHTRLPCSSLEHHHLEPLADPLSRSPSIIIGAGMSGLAMAIQFKRKLSFTDIVV
jgi:hypothetical protein